MQFLTPEFAVSPQISPEDVTVLAEQGFKVVICNRPDGETPGQTPFAEIQKLCLDQGLAFHYLPMITREDALAHVPKLQQIMAQQPGKVFAYCRSGTRSSILWQAAQA